MSIDESITKSPDRSKNRKDYENPNDLLENSSHQSQWWINYNNEILEEQLKHDYDLYINKNKNIHKDDKIQE